MKRIKQKLLTFTLTLVLLCTAAVPASAAAPDSNCSARACVRQQLCFRYCWSNCQPQRPGCPTEPETPETPEIPEIPETPDAPATPEQPEQPEQPAEPDAPSAGAPVLSMEQQVAELVNTERARYGLPALTLSAELSAGARLKSQDMADNRYFSHTSPTYGSPFEMMKSLGIRYRTAGENIAKGYATAQAVVAAWMNSEGHRANILNADYTEIGVGYVADGNHWTQWFRG